MKKLNKNKNQIILIICLIHNNSNNNHNKLSYIRILIQDRKVNKIQNQIK